MADQSQSEPHAYKWEDDISGTHDNSSAIARLHDTTSFVFIAPVGLETAGAASTANAIINLGKWAENTLYVESTSVVARANNTGLEIIFETRPASAIPWFVFKTNSGVTVSGLSAFKIDGSGIADLSGVSHFEDVRITIFNATDSSGSATVQAWLQLRTPK